MSAQSPLEASSPNRVRTMGSRGRARGAIKTRSIPPWMLMDGDAALRSDEVRRARGAMRLMVSNARDINGWPHWPDEIPGAASAEAGAGDE